MELFYLYSVLYKLQLRCFNSIYVAVCHDYNHYLSVINNKILVVLLEIQIIFYLVNIGKREVWYWFIRDSFNLFAHFLNQNKLILCTNHSLAH